MISSPSQAIPLRRFHDLDRTLGGQTALALAASAVVALFAHVSFRLPFTPVPLTLSNFAVVLVGLFLGPRLGFAALLAYLAEGASGLPVFNPGGPGGVAQLLGPTAGYLFSYPFAAAIAGWVGLGLRRHATSRAIRYGIGLLASALATTLVMVCGAAWFGHVLHLGSRAMLYGSVTPFLPGEVIKCLVAAGLYSTWRTPAGVPLAGDRT